MPCSPKTHPGLGNNSRRTCPHRAETRQYQRGLWKKEVSHNTSPKQLVDPREDQPLRTRTSQHHKGRRHITSTGPGPDMEVIQWIIITTNEWAAGTNSHASHEQAPDTLTQARTILTATPLNYTSLYTYININI